MDKYLTELTAKLRVGEEVRAEALPDIELYMDQLLTFLNQRLESGGKSPDAPVFTKTMINNYTKDHLLMPSTNKKYSQEHLMLLILIHHLKGILSINEIRRLFAPVLRDITTPDDDLIPLKDIYTVYLDLTENYLAEFTEDFEKKLAFIDNMTASIEGEANCHAVKAFLSVLVLVAQADLAKKAAEMLIEKYFPETPPDK